MDYDDNYPQGQNLNLAGEGNSKSSPVLRPYALPKFDFDDSLQAHLRFDNLVENEVFLGISSQEDSQWMEDFSRGNSGIEFNSSATESCSISRCNNVWSEATSSESVAMLLKSVGQEEMIEGETIIEESDAGNELGTLATEMEPNLKQDDKLEDVTNSQPTALPDNFPDGRNVNALESQKDNSPVEGSSGHVSNVSTGVIVSKADVGSDRICDEINHLEVDNLEKSLVDDLKGFSSETHVQNVTLSQTDIASFSELNDQEYEHQVTDACFETVESLHVDVPQQIMSEQIIRSTESKMVDLISSGTEVVCTHNVENPHLVVSSFESLEQHMAETNITSFDEPSKLQGMATSDLQVEEACKSDKGSIEPSEEGNVEVVGCNECEKNCKPLQDSLCESSVACVDDTGVEGHSFGIVNTNTGNSACTELDISIIDEKENSCGNQMDSLESQNVEVVGTKAGNSSCPELDMDSVVAVDEKENSCGNQMDSLKSQNVEVIDTKAGSSSCPELDMDSIVENEKFENHVGGGAFGEASLLPDIDHRLAEQGEASGIKHVGNPDLSLSCTVSGLHYVKQLSTEDVNDIKTPTVLKEDDTPEAQISSILLGGHMQLSKNNSSGQDDVHGFDEEIPLHGRGDAKSPTASPFSDEFSKANLAHGPELVESTSNEPGSRLVAEPLLSGTNATAEGVTLCEQGQNSQVTNLLGLKDFSQVATGLELVGLPESGQEQAAAIGCYTKVEACSVLFDSTGRQVDGTAAAEACKSHEEIFMGNNAEVALHVVADAMLLSSQTVVSAESVSVSMVEPSCIMIQKDHEVIVTPGSQSTGNPSTKAEDNQASVAVACPSKCIAECVNKDGDASANLVEENLYPPSVINSAKTPLSENGQQLRTKEESVVSVQHSEATLGSAGKVQSVSLHFQHDGSNKAKNITLEDVKGCTLASDSSQIDLTMVPENFHENSQGPGPMSGKKRAGAKGTSERKTRRDPVKTSARENSKKRGHVQDTPVKQFERGDNSMMFLGSPGNGHLVQFEELKPSSNAEQSGAKACGVLPITISNIPDLNTSVTPAAYLQQLFTDLQQVQLRAQILVHGSLMQNSVPEEACMISAFGQSDGRCIWEPSWRACSERIHSQNSYGSNPETPARSRSGSRGPDQPVKNSSLQSKTPSPAGRPSSKSIPSPVANPIIPLSSPLWNVRTPCDGLQSSGTFIDYHQPFAPLQPYQAPGIRGFVEQSPSWLSQTHFPGQWVASPPTSALDFNARVSLIPCTEPVKHAPAKVSSVQNHPVIKQATYLSVSTGDGGAGVSSGTSSQTDVNKMTVLSGQNSVNPKPKKRKKFPVSMSPRRITSLTLNQAASLSDASTHLSEKVSAPQDVVQKSLLARNWLEMGSPVVNNVLSMSNVAPIACFASTSSSGNYLAAVSPVFLSDQPTRVDQIVEKKSIVSEETVNAIELAKLQAEDAAAHAVAAVSNCNDVWSQLSKLKNSGLRSDDETKLSSAAMAAAAAASVAKAAAAAAKLALNIAVEAKLMADEVSTISVTETNTQSTGISLSGASNSSPMAGEKNIFASSIIAAAKVTVKKRVEAATAAIKHAENLDAIVKVAELAAEAVCQAGKIVSIGDPLPFRELVDSGPMDYWRTPQVSPEQGAKAHIDQLRTFNTEKLVPAERLKVGATITGKAVNPGTVTSIRNYSSRTQRGHRASDTASESYCGTNSEAVSSGDAHKIASGTSFEDGMVDGCLVEVFKVGGTCKAAWYSAKILNLKDGKAFVCYTDLQADEGSGKLKEWVHLKGDGFMAPTIRIAHPTTSMCFDGTRKRRRAEVMDYTWCVGDRVDAWMQDCWLEGVVKEKNKNDETTLIIYFPALGGTSAMKTWHLRPALTWQDGKWIEWPIASQKSASQGDTPLEKRAKLRHPAIEAAKEDNISRGVDIVESKEHDESRPLPLSTNEKEFIIGTNTRDNKLDARTAVRSGLQKEGSRVVFGVPKPGKKRKFMDVSKHLGSDQSCQNTKTSDSIKFARYLMPRGSGGRSWNNNTNVGIKEKQATENKPKVLRSGKSQSISGRGLPQTIKSLVSSKSTEKVIGNEENNSGQQELMEFGSVSNSQDTSEGPTLVSSKGPPRVSRKIVPSSNAKSVQLNKGKPAAAGGELGKKFEQDKSLFQIAEPRRSNRKIQPTSRLLEGLQSSLIIPKLPAPHEKIQRNQNRGKQ